MKTFFVRPNEVDSHYKMCKQGELYWPFSRASSAHTAMTCPFVWCEQFSFCRYKAKNSGAFCLLLFLLCVICSSCTSKCDKQENQTTKHAFHCLLMMRVASGGTLLLWFTCCSSILRRQVVYAFSAASSSSCSNKMKYPELCVFDLDACFW